MKEGHEGMTESDGLRRKILELMDGTREMEVGGGRIGGRRGRLGAEGARESRTSVGGGRALSLSGLSPSELFR